MILPRLSLVLGGASSGKSAFAERLVVAEGRPPTYIATAQALDAEMRAKIDAHRAARGDTWTTLEAPLNPGAALARVPSGGPALIDCATLWLTNVLLSGADIDAAVEDLTDALDRADGPVVTVSNEVGSGIVPENALARQFRAAQGRLNQRLAARADLVVLVVAGLPQALKGRIPDGLA